MSVLVINAILKPGGGKLLFYLHFKIAAAANNLYVCSKTSWDTNETNFTFFIAKQSLGELQVYYKVVHHVYIILQG